MPPLRCLDHVRDGRRSGAPLGLDLAYGSEATSRESFLELTGDTMVGMVVWSESGEDDLSVLVPLLLGRNNPGGRSSAIQVVDIKVDDADLRRRTNSISSLGWKTDNIGTRVVDVNFGISGVNGRESDTIPAAKFNNVLDGHDCDLIGLRLAEPGKEG